MLLKMPLPHKRLFRDSHRGLKPYLANLDGSLWFCAGGVSSEKFAQGYATQTF